METYSKQIKEGVFFLAETENRTWRFFALGESEYAAYRALKKTFIEKWIDLLWNDTKDFLHTTSSASIDEYLRNYQGVNISELRLNQVGEML